MALHYDPTDDHSTDAPTLYEAQMQHGICSEPECQWPIAGWCVGCRAKLCMDHMQEHRNLHARAAARAELAEAQAHLRDEMTPYPGGQGLRIGADGQVTRSREQGMIQQATHIGGKRRKRSASDGLY